MLLLVRQDIVHERAAVDTVLSTSSDLIEHILVETLHQATDLLGAGLPVASHPLGQVSQESKVVNGRRGTNSLNERPLLHEVVQSLDIRIIDSLGADAEDEGVGDAVAESLGVHHVLLRLGHVVEDHLRGLGLLEHPMLLLAAGLHEVLVDHLAQGPPAVTILHDKQVIRVGDHVGDNGLGTMGVDVALAINKVLDELAIGKNNGVVLVALEGVDATILLGQLGEAVILVSPMFRI